MTANSSANFFSSAVSRSHKTNSTMGHSNFRAKLRQRRKFFAFFSIGIGRGPQSVCHRAKIDFFCPKKEFCCVQTYHLSVFLPFSLGHTQSGGENWKILCLRCQSDTRDPNWDHARTIILGKFTKFRFFLDFHSIVTMSATSCLLSVPHTPNFAIIRPFFRRRLSGNSETFSLHKNYFFSRIFFLFFRHSTHRDTGEL